MDPAMFKLYPAGIRVLLVDDDSRFLKTATMLLTLLNFKVSTCGGPSSALKLLTEADKSKEVDVVLADVKKVASCGFDFKAIVEPDLHIPVFYFLSQNHKSSGAEADVLLRTLDQASFILKKPFDSDDICNLWRDIAWRKCYLNTAVGNVGQGSGLLPPLVGSSSLGQEEERVHFRMLRGVRGRKRKSVTEKPASSIQASARRRGRRAKNREQNDLAAGQDTEHLPKPTRQKRRSKRAKKDGESASMPIEIPEDMDVENKPPQPKQSLFVQSVLQTLDVPPYNPSIYADAVAGNTTAVAPASAPATPPANQAPQAPASPPVHQEPRAPTLPAAHGKRQNPAVNDTGNFAPPAADTTISTAVTDMDNALPPLLLRGDFGPVPYPGPSPPRAMQQDMHSLLNFATSNRNIQVPHQQPPAADDPFTAGTVGGAAIQAATDYGNTESTFMQFLQQLGGSGAAQDEVTGMMPMYSPADPLVMVPDHVDDIAALYNSNEEAMYYDNNGESFVAPHQVLDMSYGANNPEMAGGSFDGNASAFMAPQGFGTAPNVNQLAMVDDDPAAMFAFGETEQDYSFPLEALMDTDMQIYDSGLAGQQGGAAEGAPALTDVYAAETYLNDGEGGLENWGVGPADGFAILDELDEMLMNNLATDLFPHYLNDGRL